MAKILIEALESSFLTEEFKKELRSLLTACITKKENPRQGVKVSETTIDTKKFFRSKDGVTVEVDGEMKGRKFELSSYPLIPMTLRCDDSTFNSIDIKLVPGWLYPDILKEFSLKSFEKMDTVTAKAISLIKVHDFFKEGPLVLDGSDNVFCGLMNDTITFLHVYYIGDENAWGLFWKKFDDYCEVESVRLFY
jgi:hypothetical protein